MRPTRDMLQAELYRIRAELHEALSLLQLAERYGCSPQMANELKQIKERLAASEDSNAS